MTEMEQSSSKGRILIIEDNRLNLDMACELLELEGFEVFEAEDANSGMRQAQAIVPDLILMDLHLPLMDGFTLTRLMKETAALKDVPIVAFTAMAMQEEQQKALDYGCSGIISKPIDIKTFAQTLEGYLGGKKNGSPQASKGSRHSRTGFISSSHQPGPPSPAKQVAREKPQAVSPPVTHVPQATSHASIQPQTKHQVLVVDDNPMNVELMKEALESMDQIPLLSYDGATALQMAMKHQPDLILLDIMMPEMDGYEVLERLKASPHTAHIPVILISALNNTQNIVRGFEEGTYDYIAKPFKLAEVKARIKASLRLTELQDTLKRERDKLRSIFQFSADGIALLTPNLEVVSANPKVGHWFKMALSEDGLPLQPVHFMEILGCQCAFKEVCPLHTPNLVLLKEDRQEGQSDKQLEEIVFPDPDSQTPRYLNIQFGKVSNPWGRLEGYVVVLRDVTREKLIEQSKETFVATLTHDLKTPIHSEYMALDLLKNGTFGELSSEQQEVVAEIVQSNRYMNNLVESLVATYKYDEGKMELNLEPTQLNILIETDVAPSLKTLAEGKGLRLHLQLAENLPHVMVDPLEIQRVMNNLVQNAVNNTPSGGDVTVETSVQEEDSLVMVSVSDTGRGIEPENISHIFERYKSMTKKFKQLGTGLGLYLSLKIIEAHGGHISVDSTLGEGSRFFFTLKAMASDLSEEAPPTELAPATSTPQKAS